MSDFEDAIGDAVDDLLAEAGVACVYIRGNETTSVTLRKSTLPPVVIDNGSGHLVEIQPVDFIGKTITLPCKLRKNLAPNTIAAILIFVAMMQYENFGSGLS